ncbi:MAG: bifunctional DNA-binding transcriptional regulator/O6-methylguanine-DNA methyltransferase Ada [Acidobacteria bacterium]|nr:bifunctional DNA-binding transcriptional regulator/O6-methylguanine-DNA methyltransferase Ada [Acidobacteriota bacterium]
MPFSMRNQVGDESGLWQAVLARDAQHDGRFVYAVTSTGVYCRPSCPSRRPRRDHVRFFHTSLDAERAGFRPCQRCAPANEGPSPSMKRILEARAIIDASPDAPVRLGDLARRVGLSVFHLQRTFKRAIGVTPREYVRRRRLERVKNHLRSGGSVTDATYEAGYGSGSRLYEQADAYLGMTPGTYQRGGKGMSIRYTVVESPVGRLLCAFTDRGLCAVMVGKSDRTLERELRAEFPQAAIDRDDRSASRHVDIVRQCAEGRPLGGDLPLDVRATTFQWKVWRALREIPHGTTRSYKEVARRIGRPTAVRAVARACATNPVALVVPCHRVVRDDGELSGYRWGVDVKKRLIEQEKKQG